MHVITKRTLSRFWEQHADARDALETWYADASRAEWRSPADIKRRYANADPIAGNRVVFNLKGNDYRLIVEINYARQTLYVRFVGTHAEYNKVDAVTVKMK